MAASFNQIIADSATKLYWPCLDDAPNSDVVDYSGEGNTGTLSGDNTEDVTTAGPNGYLTKGFQLNGIDNRIASGAAIASGTPTTMWGWVKTSDDGVRVMGHYVGTNVRVIGISLNAASGTPDFFVQHFDGSNATAASGVTGGGAWKFVVGRFDSDADRSVWVNGAEEGDNTTSRGSIGTIDNFIVGMSPWSGGGQYLNGDVSGIGCTDDALTDEEIAELYNGPELNYSSGVSFSDAGVFDVGTWLLPAPFASGSNGTPTYSVIAVNAAGTVLDSASSATGTLDLSANAGNICYLLARVSNTGGYDVGDHGSRTSGYGSADDGYYEIASVTAAGGGGSSTDADTIIVDSVPQTPDTTLSLTLSSVPVDLESQTPDTAHSLAVSPTLIDLEPQTLNTTLNTTLTTALIDLEPQTLVVGAGLSVSPTYVEAVAVTPTTTLSLYPESLGVTVDIQSPAIASSITISTPESPWMYQRDGSNQADIGITVTWIGEPTAIRARWNGGAWETIDASPEGGSSSGTLSNQSAGQGTLEVDFANDAGVTDSAALITIGDIPLTLGQSNANGWLTNPQSYSGDYTALMWKRDGSGWEELADPTGYITSYGSVWPLLATLWMADQDVPVGFIHMAQNGNALVDGPWDPGNPGASYTATVARLAEAGITDAAVILYDQGEADAGNDETQQDYEDTLDLLVSSFASDTGINAPWIVAQTGTAPSAPDAEAIDRIRAAQVSRWENNANIYPGPLGYDRAGVHWESDAEAVILAGRWWAALDATVFDGSSSRGPRVQSASEAEGRTKINIRFNAALLTSLTLETDPWEVDDDGTPATIDSISYSGSTVTLTLSTALTGSGTTVSFASFNSGAGHVVPLGPEITLPDATSVSLPVEPFYDTIVSEEAAQVGSTLFQPLFTGHF